MANGETFAHDLEAVPRVKIVREPPAFQPADAPIWSLITYRNVTRASKLDSLGNYIVVDVETTGLNPDINEIVQLSAITFRDFAPVDCFTTLIKPQYGINAKAASINKITADMVENAPPVEEIRNAFRAYTGNDLPIVGHNLEFDLKFLVTSGCLPMNAARRYYDTLSLSRRTWSDGPYKLDSLGKSVLQIQRPEAHEALSDAYLTGLLFKEICALRTAK